MTLEDACDELKTKYEAYDEFTTTAKKTLDDFTNEVNELESKVVSEFDALAEDVKDFLTKVADETNTLVEDVNDAQEDLTELENAVKSTQAEAEKEVSDGQGDLTALTQKATGMAPKVEEMAANGAEKPSQALTETATEVLRELDEAMDDAKNFLEQEVTAGLETLENMTKSWADVVVKSFTDAATHLNKVYEEWAIKIAEVGDTVGKEAFGKAQDHAKECVEYALGDCKSDYETRLNILSNIVDETEGLLDQLKDAFEQKEGELQKGQESLSEEMEELKEAMEKATEALDGVAQLLAQYEFVRMS